MKCPFCGHVEDKVVDSRLSTDGEAIRRRRECEKCGRRFTSYERVEEIMPMVVKKDGRREPFDRQKVLSGLKKACEKRPVSMDTLEKVVDEIIAANPDKVAVLQKRANDLAQGAAKPLFLLEQMKVVMKNMQGEPVLPGEDGFESGDLP